MYGPYEVKIAWHPQLYARQFERVNVSEFNEVEATLIKSIPEYVWYEQQQ